MLVLRLEGVWKKPFNWRDQDIIGSEGYLQSYLQ